MNREQVLIAGTLLERKESINKLLSTNVNNHTEKKAAYCLGFYHAVYEYFQHNPFIDKYYNYYKKGFDDGIRANI